MLSKDILNHKIKVQCGYCGETIGAFIEYLESGSDEFYYRGDKTWRIREEYNLKNNKKWQPAIGHTQNCDETWTFYETWEDLIEQFKFPTGETLLEYLLSEND